LGEGKKETVMHVYIATSWKNTKYREVMEAVRSAGHHVLDWSGTEVALPDFRELDPRFEEASKNRCWTPTLAQEMLQRREVQSAYGKDIERLRSCDVLVLLTPCGRNAHFEAGFAMGIGKRCVVLLSDGVEPELMTSGMTAVRSVVELLVWLEYVEQGYRG
jgi:nucleoside 2-deoxyribosyltransferase